MYSTVCIKLKISVARPALPEPHLPRVYGINTMATPAPSTPVPHVYALLGGGDWGPRAVVKAFLESTYVGGWKTGAVVVVDMEEAKRVHRDSGIQEVTWTFKWRPVFCSLHTAAASRQTSRNSFYLLVLVLALVVVSVS